MGREINGYKIFSRSNMVAMVNHNKSLNIQIFAYNKRSNMVAMVNRNGRLNIQIFACNKMSNMVATVNRSGRLNIYRYLPVIKGQI